MFRKILLLSIHVFISDEQKILKALFGSVILFVTWMFQARKKPYKIGIITELESREMMSSILTLYGGLVFVQEDEKLQALHIIIFILVVIMNLRFLILWVFWIMCVWKDSKLIWNIKWYINCKVFMMIIFYSVTPGMDEKDILNKHKQGKLMSIYSNYREIKFLYTGVMILSLIKTPIL